MYSNIKIHWKNPVLKCITAERLLMVDIGCHVHWLFFLGAWHLDIDNLHALRTRTNEIIGINLKPKPWNDGNTVRKPAAGSSKISRTCPITVERGRQGRKQGVFGLTPPPWAWHCKKLYYLRKGDNCFRILFACLIVDLMQITRNEFACKFQGTLQMDQKVIIRF